MKIAILTLPLHTNYGGILQAYALQTVLERMGHRVKVITPNQKKLITLRLILLSVPKRLLNNLMGRKVDVFSEFRYIREKNAIRKNVNKFINKYIHQDRRLISCIKESDYNAIVVGSDQIWRPVYISKVLKSSIDNAFLGFTKDWDIKRISYSASFGTDLWEFSLDETQRIKPLIARFDAVSVRESSGVELCRDKLDIQAALMLDPTLLLDADDYINLFRINNTIKDNGTLYTYILDPSDEKQSVVNRVAASRNIRPFSVCAQPDNSGLSIKDRIQPPVEKWLKGFFDADFIVTDSFHGCVFSILFNKPFVVIGNNERGQTRIDSLLELLNIQDHLLTKLDDYSKDRSYSVPESSRDVLRSYRQQSLLFLRNNVSA